MADMIQMDSNTFCISEGFVHFFLLCGEEKAVLIDSGMNTPEAKKLAETCTKLPILLVNTHGDRDHVSGTAAFDKIYMKESDYINCGVKESFPDTSLVPLEDGDVIDLGGRHLEIVDLPGHTYGSIAILDVEKRRLFTGDSVQDGTVFMFGGHRAPEKFAASLEKIQGMKDRYDSVVASHGTMVLPADYVEKVLDAWKMVQSGQITPVPADMHGTKVDLYKAEACGFFC